MFEHCLTVEHYWLFAGLEDETVTGSVDATAIVWRTAENGVGFIFMIFTAVVTFIHVGKGKVVMECPRCLSLTLYRSLGL